MALALLRLRGSARRLTGVWGMSGLRSFVLAGQRSAQLTPRRPATAALRAVVAGPLSAAGRPTLLGAERCGARCAAAAEHEHLVYLSLVRLSPAALAGGLEPQRARQYSSQPEAQQGQRRDAAARGRQPGRRKISRSNRRKKPQLSKSADAARQATRQIVDLIDAGDRDAAWQLLSAQAEPNTFHCTAMVTGCTTATQIADLRELMTLAGVDVDVAFLSALHTAWIALGDTGRAVAALQEMADTGSEWNAPPPPASRSCVRPLSPAACYPAGSKDGVMVVGVNTEKRWRGLAAVGLKRLLDEAAPTLPWRQSPGRVYLELLQQAGLARVEHYNVVLARCDEDDDSLVDELLVAMETAGVEKTIATATTLFTRRVNQGRFGQALATFDGLDLSEEGRTRLLAFSTNTLKRLCDEGGGSKRGEAFLEALVGFGMANATHFNVCLNVVGDSVGEDQQERVEVEVTAKISRLMQKMERVGVQPDGSTYSTLHSVWLRLDNVSQAVGALAQAKQRAADPRRRASDNEGIGGPLWDEEERTAELCCHIQLAWAMDTASEGAVSGRRAAKSGQLWGYYAELQRQGLATIAVYNAMFEVCRLSVEVDTIVNHMESSACQADKETYPVLHRAWVRASDLSAAMATLRIFKLPEVAKLGVTSATLSSTVRDTLQDLVDKACPEQASNDSTGLAGGANAASMELHRELSQGYLEALQEEGLLEPVHVAMALPLCDTSEAVEGAAATIALTQSSGNDAVVAAALVKAWARAGKFEAVVQTAWRALETGCWQHRDVSQAMTAALKQILGIGTSVSSKSKSWGKRKGKKQRDADAGARREGRHEARRLFAALQSAGLADGFQYSLMLRNSTDRLDVQRLLDEMDLDSALSWRGGGGGLVLDGTTRKLLKRNWPLARVSATVKAGYKGEETTAENEAEDKAERDAALHARLEQLLEQRGKDS